MTLHSEQDAIKRAVEGGYSTYPLHKGYEFVNYATVAMPNNFFVRFEDGSDIHIAAIFSDPAFWQALGKARGWKHPRPYCLNHPDEHEECCATRVIEESKLYALRYFETLLSGGDMKKFWESLP